MIKANVIESLQSCLIRYNPRGTSYMFKGPIRVKIKDLWVVHYAFNDFKGNAYARASDNFQDFDLCYAKRL